MNATEHAKVPQEPWLSLKQASQQLGVHPTTLRRWADNGEIPVMLTPGGHRRFLVSDIERFAAERRRVKIVSDLEQVWANGALTQARNEIVSHRNEHWLAVFDEKDREHSRQLGRRLLGLMLQYVSINAGGDELIRQGEAIGRDQAASALTLGLPLVEALQATLFFRDLLVESALNLPELVNVRPGANLRLLRRINTMLNAVQLAVADTYDRAK
jgi:excisionase family DNA binding protein